MNRAYPDMLHCFNTSNVTGVQGMEMSVLEQQKMFSKRQQAQHLQLQQQQPLSCFNELSRFSFLPPQTQELHAHHMDCDPSPVAAGPTLNELIRPIKTDPSIDNGWMDFGMQQSGVTVKNSGAKPVSQVNSPSYGMNYTISRTASCPHAVPMVATTMNTDHAEVKGKENVTSEQKLKSAAGKESFNKRKAEKSPETPKAVEVEEINRSKRSKVCATEEESKIPDQFRNRNSNQSKQKDIVDKNNVKKDRETSGCTSKDNSKASDVQKPDYIHVRARRGQATDSHSLAERVRREKISERMRHLQDLVPGCNKITGKAGMLDEIINYVQSLQRQVEFLSMKLAAVNSSIEFNIDDLFAKEILAACSSSLTMRVSPDFTNHNYPYNPIQQMDPVCGSEDVANSIDVGIRGNISFPVLLPETLTDTSCFNQITNSFQWDANSKNMYNMEFQQARSTSFPLQTFTGTIEANSLKMEM